MAEILFDDGYDDINERVEELKHSGDYEFNMDPDNVEPTIDATGAIESESLREWIERIEAERREENNSKKPQNK